MIDMSRLSPCCIYAAGGGGEVLGLIQAQSGASRVLLDGGVPYSREAVTLLVGRPQLTRVQNGLRVGGATSWEASHLLASAAWVQACRLSSPESEAAGTLSGVAVTVIISGRDSTRKHPDVAYIVIRTGPSGSRVFEKKIEWELGQKTQTREEQSLQLALEVLDLAYQASTDPGLVRQVPEPNWEGDRWIGAFDKEWTKTGPGEIPENRYLFGGSWNPLHHGHLWCRTQADLRLGRQGVLVLSRNHPVKGPVDPDRIGKLVAATYGVCDILISNDLGKFTDLARFGLPMLVGLDVIQHISEGDLESIAPLLRLVDREGSAQADRIRAAQAGIPTVLVSPLSISSTRIREHRS